MELKTTLKLRKFINNTKPELPGFSDETYPLNFTNPYWRNQANAEWDNEYSANTYLNLARDIKPVSISGMSDDVLKNRLGELKTVPLKEPKKSALQNTKDDDINIAPILSSGTAFAKSLGDAYKTDMTTDLLILDAGTSEGTVGGIKYKRINPIYKDGKLPSFAGGLHPALNTAATGAGFGASVGSIIPGIGTGIGAVAGGLIGGIAGLFGSKRREDKERELKEEANRIRLNTNSYNYSSALNSAASTLFIALDTKDLP